jgi:hypothetical protein
MSENPILMTQAEYARHRNKSPQYIGAYSNASSTWFNGFAPAKVVHVNYAG